MSTAADPMPAPIPLRPEALSPRGREILCAVRHVFAEKGFERASMQDLARAAGMSVGNFYRYFPSKAAMIEALVLSDVDRTCRHFDGVLSAAEPVQALRARLRALVLLPADAAGDDRRIWAEISVAALRDPAYARIIARLEHRIADNLLAVMALSAGLEGPQAAERFRPHAELILLLVKASIFELPPPEGAPPGPLAFAPLAPAPLASGLPVSGPLVPAAFVSPLPASGPALPSTHASSPTVPGPLVATSRARSPLRSTPSAAAAPGAAAPPAPQGAPSPLKQLILRQLDLLLTEIADARPKEIPSCR